MSSYKRKSERGVTLIETLTVMGIIALLSAIVYSVMPGAVLSARAQDTKTRLRQIYLAVDLYRTDHDGGPVGDLRDLGLPSILTLVKGPSRNLGLPTSTWVSGCSPHPHSNPPNHTMFYFPGEGGPALTRASQDLGDHLLLVSDDECNPPEIMIDAPHVTKRGLGLLLNGTLVDRRAEGNPHDPYWWTTNQDSQ